MKRWFFLTVVLYLAILVLASTPVVYLAFWPHVDRGDVAEMFTSPLLWIGIAILVAAQALLLLVPVGSARNRPKPRRKLLIPVITSAFFMAVLVLCTGLCAFLAIWGDSGGPFGDFFGGTNGATYLFYTLGLITALFWIFWAWLFYRYRHAVDPDLLTHRLMRWLLAGSILELLVAVPSHVIVRQRGDCCAPVGTFFGITCGLAVMFLSFGPGTFFLFARRMDLLRGRLKVIGQCRKCGYDLRAHHPGERCPECGTTVPAETPPTEPVASARDGQLNH